MVDAGLITQPGYGCCTLETTFVRAWYVAGRAQRLETVDDDYLAGEDGEKFVKKTPQFHKG